jgi:aspartate racemase
MTGKKIGVIGGLGPLATNYFLNLFFAHWQKVLAPRRDQDFPEMAVEFACQTPDRTAFIIGDSDENPLPKLILALRSLEKSGCNIIVIPCNTAHFFIKALNEAKLPETRIVDMVEETAARCVNEGLGRVLLLATRGTITSQIYKNAFVKLGSDLLVPGPEDIDAVMRLIYGESGIKAGNFGAKNAEKLAQIAAKYTNLADACILGCTELPLIAQNISMVKIDPMLVLAEVVCELLS